ncbi:MAG: DUF2157 domain-containing protein [bacterium]|nr:DUF2157 domain-containing protein [bacterium]
MAEQKLVEYVKISLAQGKPKEEIYKELLGQGHTIEVIQECFNSLIAEEDKEDTSKRTIRIIVLIGAVLVGAGVFSFIAANWQEMTRPIKIGVILLSMVISYGAGWYMKERANLFNTGEALILLGAIIYGAGIFLVAQMFNIRANWPDGFILWMIGTIVMAFAIESYYLFYFAIPLGVIALGGHPFGIFTGVGYNSFLLTSSFLLLASTIITFVTGWIIRKRISPELKEFY